MKKTVKKGLSFKKILKVRINSTLKEEVLGFVQSSLKKKKKIFIVTPNPEQLVLANEDSNFLQALNQANLAIPDGIGLLWAAKILGKKIKERISGIDLMLALCQMAKAEKWRIFLLGGQPGVAKRAAKRLTENLKLKAENISYYSGPRDIKKETKQQRQEIIKKINQFRPDLLFVAFGAPYQEKWLYQNLEELKVGVGMVVGGSLDYLSGRLKRAPRFLQKIGLEWLWRLIQEPWRIKRQRKLLKFVWLVLKERFFNNF